MPSRQRMLAGCVVVLFSLLRTLHSGKIVAFPYSDISRYIDLTADEQRLYFNLFQNYSPISRPVYNASSTVVVKFGFTLTQLADVDERNQVLTTSVWLEQEWFDERLKWDPADYNGLQVLRLPCDKIWLPDIVLYNNADDYNQGYMKSKAMVRYDGNVFWPPPARLKSTCKIDITYFPWDDQKCRLKFGSWTYDGFQLDLVNRSTFVDLSNYIFSGEWELISVKVKRNVVFYPCCPEPFPDVTFTIHIQRRVLYYMFNIILPCIWLSILSLLGFWLPPDSGEKITLGITVLLAFSVFMLLVAENMPATSEFVPLIGIYLTVVMGLTSLSIVLTVVVLQLHHGGQLKRQIPTWLMSSVRVMAKIVFMDLSAANRKNAPKAEYCDLDETSRANSYAMENIERLTRGRGPLCNGQVMRQLLSTEPPGLVTSTGTGTPRDLFCDRLAYHLQLLITKHQLEETRISDEGEWKVVAQVVDRFLFWVFAILTLLSSIVILIVVPVFKPAASD